MSSGRFTENTELTHLIAYYSAAYLRDNPDRSYGTLQGTQRMQVLKPREGVGVYLPSPDQFLADTELHRNPVQNNAVTSIIQSAAYFLAQGIPLDEVPDQLQIGLPINHSRLHWTGLIVTLNDFKTFMGRVYDRCDFAALARARENGVSDYDRHLQAENGIKQLLGFKGGQYTGAELVAVSDPEELAAIVSVAGLGYGASPNGYTVPQLEVMGQALTRLPVLDEMRRILTGVRDATLLLAQMTDFDIGHYDSLNNDYYLNRAKRALGRFGARCTGKVCSYQVAGSNTCGEHTTLNLFAKSMSGDVPELNRGTALTSGDLRTFTDLFPAAVNFGALTDDQVEAVQSDHEDLLDTGLFGHLTDREREQLRFHMQSVRGERDPSLVGYAAAILSRMTPGNRVVDEEKAAGPVADDGFSGSDDFVEHVLESLDLFLKAASNQGLHLLHQLIVNPELVITRESVKGIMDSYRSDPNSVFNEGGAGNLDDIVLQAKNVQNFLAGRWDSGYGVSQKYKLEGVALAKMIAIDREHRALRDIEKARQSITKPDPEATQTGDDRQPVQPGGAATIAGGDNPPDRRMTAWKVTSGGFIVTAIVSAIVGFVFPPLVLPALCVGGASLLLGGLMVALTGRVKRYFAKTDTPDSGAPAPMGGFSGTTGVFGRRLGGLGGPPLSLELQNTVGAANASPSAGLSTPEPGPNETQNDYTRRPWGGRQ